jgi:predicted Zn-dependent protease
VSSSARRPRSSSTPWRASSAPTGALEAQELKQRARTLHEKRLADFPEAASGHALDHFLQDPADAQRALALARENFANRGYGEAAIALARAWMLAGQPERAVPLLEAQLEAGWDTAEAHWVLAQALQQSGEAGRAAKARALALRANPQSERMY